MEAMLRQYARAQGVTLKEAFDEALLLVRKLRTTPKAKSHLANSRI
jgi:hypothetical protein